MRGFSMKCLTRAAAIALLILAGSIYAYAQETWMNYGKENVITDIAIRGNDIWCATTNGLISWDKRDMSYRKYTMKEGLPHSVINSLDIAPDGAVWCGTVGGVARFDGRTWRVFTQKDGLPDTPVSHIAVGPDGVVWAGTYYYGSYVETSGHGISRYDGSNWTTFTFPNGNTWKNQVLDIVISPDSTVWASNSSGVFRFDGKGMSFTYPTSGGTLLSPAPDNRLWVLNQTKIIKTWTMSFVSFATLTEGNGGVSLYGRNDGSLWVGTMKGVLRYDGAAWNLFTTSDGLCDNYVSAITEDESGVIWIGTHNGLSRFDGTSFRTYRTEEELINNTVTALAFEPNGAVWFGTSDGISRYNGRKWRSFTTADGLPDSAISAVTVTTKGDVWAATSKGVARFIGSGWKTYTTTDGLSDNAVLSAASGKDNSVWFGTKKGVTRFDGTTWKTYSEPGENIYRLVATSDGTIWCGYGYTLYRFTNDTWTSFTVGKDAGPSLTTMSAGPDSMLYYITAENTSMHYQSYQYRLYRMRSSDQFATSLPNGRSGAFSVNKNGVLWFGDYFGFSGMNRDFHGGAYQVRRGETTHFLDSDGLVYLGVNLIATAPDGAVWFGTGGGLSRYGAPMTTGVESEPALPKEFAVVNNYPNPFNPSTTISFTLPNTGRAELAVYSITGQKIRTLLSGPMTAGSHSAVWDGKDDAGKAVSSGVYIAQIRSGRQTASRLMALVK